MSGDMQELRRRILFMLRDDDNGNGQYSVGLKAKTVRISVLRCRLKKVYPETLKIVKGEIK